MTDDRGDLGPGEFYPVVGVGPHPKPWPEGDQYDPELLENGDRRNVLDHYRYWSVEPMFRSCCQFSIAICSGLRLVSKSLTIASTDQYR